jgi:hypothetical protein
MNPRSARPCMALVAAAAVLAAPARPTLHAGQAPQKTAFVTVVADAKGPLKDLTAKDFVAYEDNAKRDVLGADLAGDSLSVFLIVDTSSPPPGTPPMTQDLRTALATFVRTLKLSGSDIEIALCPTSNAAVTAVDFGKLVELDAAIGRIVPEATTTSVILEAITEGGKALKNKPAPRRALVSVDFDSQEGSAEKAMKPAIQSVHDSGATVWTVSVRGSTNAQMGTASQQSALIVNNANRETVLNNITKANGGMRFTVRDPSGLEGALKGVANTLASQYEVTFSHPGGKATATRFETTSGAKVLLSPFMR